MHIYVPVGSENSEETTTYRILLGNLFEIDHFGDQERSGRIILKHSILELISQFLSI
jgi:hypothetical protein